MFYTPEIVRVGALMFAASMLTLSAGVMLAAPALAERLPALLRWPQSLTRIVGLIALLAAACLVVPQTRLWGVAAAVCIAGTAILAMSFSGKVLGCLPAFVFLAAVAVAVLA